jgi:hypothetical protein
MSIAKFQPQIINTCLSGFWDHCKDNVGVSRYAIWREGARIGNTAIPVGLALAENTYFWDIY